MSDETKAEPMVKEADARKLARDLVIQAQALEMAVRWLDGIKQNESTKQSVHLLRVQADTLRAVSGRIDVEVCGDIPF